MHLIYFVHLVYKIKTNKIQYQTMEIISKVQPNFVPSKAEISDKLLLIIIKMENIWIRLHNSASKSLNRQGIISQSCDGEGFWSSIAEKKRDKLREIFFLLLIPSFLTTMISPGLQLQQHICRWTIVPHTLWRLHRFLAQHSPLGQESAQLHPLCAQVSPVPWSSFGCVDCHHICKIMQ